MTRPNRSLTIVAALCGVLALMGVVTTYSVTLYRLFCQATGAGGTTQRVAVNGSAPSTREVTVFFDTSVSPGLPWRFAPVQHFVKLHLGQDALVFFTAENLSDQELVGHATFNVTPEKTGPYFKKIQCFCFNEERLAPHARVEMPVDFFVDPALATDPNTEDVHEITLSYTFFHSLRPAGAVDLARFTASPANPQAGGLVFAERCAACHGLDAARIGPPLRGVVGRAAAHVPGFAYSAALSASGLTWDPATLDRWLANPAQLVPGTRMGVAVPDVLARRDLVAYLRSLPAAGS